MNDLVDQVNPKRLADDLWELVNIPSPTLNESEAALNYAEMLRDCGAEVEIDETIKESPNVVGRLKGNRSGPTLQLAGHIDHIDVPHPPPERRANIISGRGSADMKNGLAGILEITRLLSNSEGFPGELLITVYGRHEAPNGDSAGLCNLLNQGIMGDAAIVFEGPDDEVVISSRGMSIWEIELAREGEPCHENTGDEKGWGLVQSLRDILTLLDDRNSLLRTSSKYPLLPPESVFLGQAHYGDFYNRVPNKLWLQGTRRWHPGKTLEQIKTEFSEWLSGISLPIGIGLKQHWTYVGDAYAIEPDERIVESLLKAYRNVADLHLTPKGHSSVNDVCRLVALGHVPAVPCAFDTATAHANYEFAKLDCVSRSCRVALAASLEYLTTSSEEVLR